MAFEQARGEAGSYDFLGTYVDDLPNVVDLARIREAGVRIGADPLGGASVAYWGEIGERHGLDLTVVNPRVDPQWAFMTLDWDGKIRMDCSSPVRDGLAHPRQGRLRHLDGQRRRRRPARHRHARRRPDEPQPLPRRRDPVPLRRGPPGLARDDRHRQDPRVVLDDRPGRRRPRPHAARGAGGLQVVRARAARRLGRASAARSPPAPASCARTARSGRPTRTASCSPCSPPRSSRPPARRPASTTPS